MLSTMIFAADDVNLAAGWDNVWGGLKEGLGAPMLNMLTAIGVLIVVASLFKWMWDKRRGGGGGMGGQSTNNVLYSLLVGVALSTPQVIIPVLLTILDAVANAVLGIWNGTSGGS